MKVTVIVEQRRYKTDQLAPPTARILGPSGAGDNLLDSKRCNSVEDVKDVVAARLHQLLPDQDVHIVWDFRKPPPPRLKSDPGKGAVGG